MRATITGTVVAEREQINKKTGVVGRQLTLFQGGRSVVNVLGDLPLRYEVGSEVKLEVDVILTRTGYLMVFERDHEEE